MTFVCLYLFETESELRLKNMKLLNVIEVCHSNVKEKSFTGAQAQKIHSYYYYYIIIITLIFQLKVVFSGLQLETQPFL